jgi:L-glutamine-phosphate cytidylyltransferase
MTPTINTGIILAAGLGTRLNGSPAVRAKCLAAPGGIPLIDRQMQTLRACGIDRIMVVVGFDATAVRAACGTRVAFFENTAFAETNSLYSLWLARPALRDGCVVMNCDVLFDPRLLEDLLDARHEDALLVSYPNPGDREFGDEEMKVQVRQGRVVAMAKDLSLEESEGEIVGIAKFGATGAAHLVHQLDRLVKAGHTRAWVPRGFQAFAEERPLYAVGTRGRPWIEIDTPEDYRRAVREVLPTLEGREPCRQD